jgi:UDP-N-acetylglucosamine/UDP-N-acetylgalactosamine diphosphorylase
MAALPERRERMAAALERVGQGHVLRHADELPAERLERFLAQLEALELPRLASLIEEVLAPRPAPAAGARLQPCELIEAGDSEAQRARDASARAAGEELLAQGAVAAFLVAGGQGTRLGYDGPKGRFPVGPLTNRSLFAYHAQRVLATSRRYGAPATLYVMTSEANHASSVAAFDEARHFGLEPEQVVFLTQGMLPAVDRDGRLLLAARGELCMSPDGHGGSLHAMARSGTLDDMERRGIREIFYFQVDNPLARVLDPVFIGHHALARAEMSSKVVPRRDATEKVGVVARIDGRVGVIEYSDLPPEVAAERDAEGRLRHRAGNIAIHMLSVPFVRRITGGGLQLPVHRADKAVPCLDASGAVVKPSRPNAVKMEMFVFDALGFAERVVTQEVRREDEFAPVKNAEGEDSPATARAALADQARRWMAAAGLLLPGSAKAEIGPLFALDQEEFLANLTRGDYGPVFDRS